MKKQRCSAFRPFVALRKGSGEGKTSMGRTVISTLWGRA